MKQNDILTRAEQLLSEKLFEEAYAVLKDHSDEFIENNLESEMGLLLSLCSLLSAIEKRRSRQVRLENKHDLLAKRFLTKWNSPHIAVSVAQKMAIRNKHSDAFSFVKDFRTPDATSQEKVRQLMFVGEQVAAFSALAMKRSDAKERLLEVYSAKNVGLPVLESWFFKYIIDAEVRDIELLTGLHHRLKRFHVNREITKELGRMSRSA